jgi:hypothetical protein
VRGDEDLRPLTVVEKFSAAVVDVDRGVALLLSGEGVLRRYSVPEFKGLGRHKIGVAAYQAALDDKTGQLYLGGIDLTELGSRPRSRGFGDIYVFDVRSLLESK